MSGRLPSERSVGTVPTPARPGHAPTPHSSLCPTTTQCPTSPRRRSLDDLQQAPHALVQNGEDVNAANARGETPLGVATIGEGTTRSIASLLEIELAEEGLGSRKAAIAEYLRQRGATAGRTAGVADLLMEIPLFSHLWFLWFLWWLVLGLAAVSTLGCAIAGDPDARVAGPLARSLPLAGPPDDDSPVVHGTRAALTCPSGRMAPPARCRSRTFWRITQSSSASGRSYFGFGDRSGRVGERWWPPLSIALLVVFPLGMVLTEAWPGPLGVRPDPLPLRVLAVFLQVAYPWLMTFGLMGLFRRFCPVESPKMRYLSDSAYWLYLAHLPLIIAAQYEVRDWPLPALAKFLLIVAVVTAFLLWTYQTLVRYTWLGRFLNGPRVRPARAGAPAVVA